MHFSPQDYRTSLVRMRSIISCDKDLRLVYLELLFALWEQGGSLPAEADDLVEELGLDAAVIERCLPILEDFGRKTKRGGITIENGRITNLRISEDIAVAKEFLAEQAERGRLGGMARARQRLSDRQASASRSLSLDSHSLSLVGEQGDLPGTTSLEAGGNGDLQASHRGGGRAARIWQVYLASREEVFAARGKRAAAPPAFTQARARLIEKFCGEYGEELVCDAAAGLQHSDWHNGRKDGVLRLSPENVFHVTAKINQLEILADLARRVAAGENVAAPIATARARSADPRRAAGATPESVSAYARVGRPAVNLEEIEG